MQNQARAAAAAAEVSVGWEMGKFGQIFRK